MSFVRALFFLGSTFQLNLTLYFYRKQIRRGYTKKFVELFILNVLF